MKIERNRAQQDLFGKEVLTLNESSSSHCANLMRAEVAPSRRGSRGFDDDGQYTMFRILHSSARHLSPSYSIRCPTGTKITWRFDLGRQGERLRLKKKGHINITYHQLQSLQYKSHISNP